MKRFLILVLSIAMITFAACDDSSSSTKLGKAQLGYPADGSVFKADKIENQFEWKTVQNPIMYKYWNAGYSATLQEECQYIYLDLYVSGPDGKMVHVEEQMASWEWDDDPIYRSSGTIHTLFEKAGTVLAAGKTYYWQVAVTLPDGTSTKSDRHSFTVIPSDPSNFAITNEQGNAKFFWNSWDYEDYGTTTSPMLCDLYVSTTIPVVGTDTPKMSNIKPTYSGGTYAFTVNSKDFTPAAFDMVAAETYYVTIVTKPAIATAATDSAKWNVTEVARGYKYPLQSDWTRTIATADFNYDTTLYTTADAYLDARYLATTGAINYTIGSNYGTPPVDSYPSLYLPSAQTLSLDTTITLNNFNDCSFQCDFRLTSESDGFNLVIDDSNNANAFVGTDYDFTAPSTNITDLKGIVVSAKWWADDDTTTTANDPRFTIAGLNIVADDQHFNNAAGTTHDADTVPDIWDNRLAGSPVTINDWHRLKVVRSGTTLATTQYQIFFDNDTATPNATIQLTNVSTYPYDISRFTPNRFTLTAESALFVDNVTFTVGDTAYTRSE